MPSHDGVRLHEYHRRAPVPPAPRQGNPKQSVARLEVRALGRAFQCRQLLPQRQVLQDQFSMAAKRQRQRTADHNEQLQHASIVAGIGARINADEFWRGSGAVHPALELLHGDNVAGHRFAHLDLKLRCV